MNDLGKLRQSGDIDLWLMPKSAIVDDKVTMSLDERKHTICQHLNTNIPHYDKSKEGYLHTSLTSKIGTNIELHFTPSYLSSPSRNRLLQQWFEKQWIILSQHKNKETTGNKALLKFNIIYALLHIYRHIIYEGIALRQMTDYYFVLQAALGKTIPTLALNDDEWEEIKSDMQAFGIHSFLSAVIWIMKTVFMMESESIAHITSHIGIEMDVKQGKMILSLIEDGGDFGKHGEFATTELKGSLMKRIKRYIKRNALIFRYYHNEVCWHWVRKI